MSEKRSINYKKITLLFALIAALAGLFTIYNSVNQIGETNLTKSQNELNNIVLMIEKGKQCKNNLVEKKIEGEEVTYEDKYNCFKQDSIFCKKMEDFIDKNRGVEVITAIDYYISYYENKKVNKPEYRIKYKNEIEKLKYRKLEALQRIAKN